MGTTNEGEKIRPILLAFSCIYGPSPAIAILLLLGSLLPPADDALQVEGSSPILNAKEHFLTEISAVLEHTPSSFPILHQRVVPLPMIK